MSSKQKSIYAVLKAAEGKEHDALTAHRKLDEVVEARQALVDGLSREVAALEEKLRKSSEEDRYSALFKGQGAVLSTLEAFRERVERELKLARAALAERTIDLKRAAERAEIAQQELIGARVEKKKAEHLLTNMREAEAVLKQADEEDKADDYNNFRRK